VFAEPVYGTKGSSRAGGEGMVGTLGSIFFAPGIEPSSRPFTKQERAPGEVSSISASLNPSFVPPSPGRRVFAEDFGPLTPRRKNDGDKKNRGPTVKSNLWISNLTQSQPIDSIWTARAR